MTDQETTGLTFYGYPECPYCARIQAAMSDLGFEFSWRNTATDMDARQELVNETGNTQVPAIRDEDGSWLKESADIVALLYSRFGDGRPPPAGLRYEKFATPLMWGFLIAGGFIGGGLQAPLWAAACAVAATRSFVNAQRSSAPAHYIIAALFAFGFVSLAAQATLGIVIPWWYAAFAVVPILLLFPFLRRRTRA